MHHRLFVLARFYSQREREKAIDLAAMVNLLPTDKVAIGFGKQKPNENKMSQAKHVVPHVRMHSKVPGTMQRLSSGRQLASHMSADFDGASFRISAAGRKAFTTAVLVSMYGPSRRSMQ